MRKAVCSPRRTFQGLPFRRNFHKLVLHGLTFLTVHTHVVRGVGGTPAPQASAGSRAESLQPPAPAAEAPCSPVST